MKVSNIEPTRIIQVRTCVLFCCMHDWEIAIFEQIFQHCSCKRENLLCKMNFYEELSKNQIFLQFFGKITQNSTTNDLDQNLHLVKWILYLEQPFCFVNKMLSLFAATKFLHVFWNGVNSTSMIWGWIIGLQYVNSFLVVRCLKNKINLFQKPALKKPL